MGRHLTQLEMLQVGTEGGEGRVSRRGWRQRWAGTSPSLRCSRWGLREGDGRVKGSED